FLSRHSSLLALHSFPTRRSSDLNRVSLSRAFGSTLTEEGSLRCRDTPRIDRARATHPGGHDHERNHDSECTDRGPPVLCTRCRGDRKSTRLNSSHRTISYAVFCL